MIKNSFNINTIKHPGFFNTIQSKQSIVSNHLQKSNNIKINKFTNTISTKDAKPEEKLSNPTYTRCYSKSQEIKTEDIQKTNLPPYLSGNEIRNKFLKFFEKKGHKILPSASLVPTTDPTVLLTIAGMLPFKPIFLGQENRSVPRATTAQRCVRTNDIENVGMTSRHHTFFEMLGNFSFGDYFKKQAIKWAWELSTEELGIPKDRIWISVYKEDKEAYEIWKNEIGIIKEKIIKLDEKDNFWAAGPTGPCGPCSELYYDLRPEKGIKEIDLDDDSRFIEFYNLVFMSMNRVIEAESMEDCNFMPLKSKNIDTGMGLERVARILQNVNDNYETDLIFPIIKKMSELANLDYFKCNMREEIDLKVIGDHMRALVFMTSDGIIPSNIGRGYILRRLIRRVIIKARLLGIENAFISELTEFTINHCKDINNDILTEKEKIINILHMEEQQFSKTLAAGQKKLSEYISKLKEGNKTDNRLCLSGEAAFKLFDTYGFPLEITQEIIASTTSDNIEVDVVGFEKCMEAQRQISKESRQDINLTDDILSFQEITTNFNPTKFLGYDDLRSKSKVLVLLKNGEKVNSVSEGESIEVILDKTPFYAESGGQIGDQGIFQISNSDTLIKISDVQKKGQNYNVHIATVEKGEMNINDNVIALVNEEFRQRVKCHHTATHLLQSALKRVLGEETSQQGSMVSGDRLRFDFNLSRPVTEEEIENIEKMINKWIMEGYVLNTKIMELEEAKQKGAIAMFGEKYDKNVRVVEIPNVSMELCGGTHVQNTSEIGIFKIISESGIQSGVRRIEAVAGLATFDYLRIIDRIVKEMKNKLNVSEELIIDRVKNLQQDLISNQKIIINLKKELGKAKAQALISNIETINDKYSIIIEEIQDIDVKAIQDATIDLQKRLGEDSIIVLGTKLEDRVAFVVALGGNIVKKGLKAGKIVSEIAGKCGSKGGGKANLAQAGGREIERFEEALEFARRHIKDQLTLL